MKPLKPLRIGSLKLKNPLILAPMLEITDLPYRLLCRKAGAALAYTEMLNLGAILHENEKTKRMMQTIKADRPLGIQITGNNIKEFEKSVPFLANYDLVDLNCGCPSNRIISNNSGSYLLNNPKKISSIIRLLKSKGFIVTAKLRLGFKTNNLLKIAKKAEKAGADALTIHARMANQGYDKPADWSWIEKAKKEIGIPIIGNGDIFTCQDVKKMLEIADGAMIARASIGEPLVFSRILHYLKTGKEKPFDFKANIKSFQDYLNLSEKYKTINISKIKHLGGHFIRNIRGASALRNELMQKKTIDEIQNFVKNLS